MKYLLWDFDNTLAYRDGMWSATIYELLVENGYNELKYEEIRPYLKSGFPWHFPEVSHEELFKGKKWWDYMNGHFAGVLKELGVEENLANQVASSIKERYLDKKKWYLYDDTILCLKKALEKNYKNIIVSNHVPELEELVKVLGIRNYFLKIYSSAHMGYEKPNIRFYEKVINELKDAESITMIGDNYIADIQGARNAGIDAILVRKSNDNNYDKYFSTLSELAKFI